MQYFDVMEGREDQNSPSLGSVNITVPALILLMKLRWKHEEG